MSPSTSPAQRTPITHANPQISSANRFAQRPLIHLHPCSPIFGSSMFIYVFNPLNFKLTTSPRGSGNASKMKTTPSKAKKRIMGIASKDKDPMNREAIVAGRGKRLLQGAGTPEVQARRHFYSFAEEAILAAAKTSSCGDQSSASEAPLRNFVFR
ncbi:hypothetical protein L596_030162 [Steinernema carpocapsae]|uniref:Uncharacterized protein n=1 Tax=Steinernema carpocapsae TaxID=34508 RepID=A0A4U5LRX1_STECR|nr:hypothetical protein L596_030162 [Steinernema carpocapsae]